MTDSTRSSRPAGAARADWEDRIGRPSGTRTPPAGVPLLSSPHGLLALPGRGQVTLDWRAVPGAIGYLVHTAPGPDGPWTPLDHHGGDVLAVPHPPYADTTGEPGREIWYAVAALSDIDAFGALSAPICAAALTEGDVNVILRVDASLPGQPLPRPWRPMIGSEHLSHLQSVERTGGQEIGAGLRAALCAVRDAWHVQTVRAHGILGDDLGVYREVDGQPVHDFSGVDRVYDELLGLGLRPVVELSFMPRDLASDPGATVFAYDAIVSPPKDWDRWGDLVRDLVAHLVERYGLAEVRDRWSFEVWNEANLEVFWSGTPEQFFRLYDVAARAVHEVCPELRVGGPSSAAAGWVEQLLAHLDGSGAPCNFLSTHTYGSPPLDLRPVLERHGRAGTPIWWTEWGVTPTHFNPASDGALSAAFLLRGMHSALGRIDALAYWVASDHFEELGRPSALFHGGFGLLTVGGLRKPRFWALALLDRLGEERLPVDAAGDGADSLVESLAARRSDGAVAVCVWNGTLDQSTWAGSASLERHLHLRLTGLTGAAYELRHWRVDTAHSNIRAVWERLGGESAWPDEEQWAALHAADELAELEPVRRVVPADGGVDVEFDLPMPAISLVELVPVSRR